MMVLVASTAIALVKAQADNFEITSDNQDGIALVNSQKAFEIPEGNYKLIVNEEMNLLKVEGDQPIILVDMYMIGSFNQWNTSTKVPMELVDGKYVLTMEMGTGNASEFKLMDANNKWYGAQSEGNFLISQDMVNTPETFITILKDGGNNMYFDVAGEYTFTYDPYERKLYVTTTTSGGVFGDVNGDGEVTTVDITCIYNYMLTGDETYLATSDVNGDGEVTTVDITCIYNILLGN